MKNYNNTVFETKRQSDKIHTLPKVWGLKTKEEGICTTCCNYTSNELCCNTVVVFDNMELPNPKE